MIDNKYTEEYQRKIIYEDLEKAKMYKNKFLLNQKIYKFIYLDDINTEANGRKIKSIFDRKIWVSSYKDFNDPFELAKVYIDEKTLTSNHYKKEILQDGYEFIKNSLKISCFTDEFEYNLPMWAHYANNHKGLCLEFEVVNPNCLYPVIYANTRKLNANTTIHNFLAIMHRFGRGITTEEELDKLNEISNLLITIFSTKEKPWKYEREYRIFYPCNEKVDGGLLVDMKTVGLKLTGVYLGIRMNELYIQKFRNKANHLGIKLYQMYIDKNNTEFKLDHKQI